MRLSPRTPLRQRRLILMNDPDDASTMLLSTYREGMRMSAFTRNWISRPIMRLTACAAVAMGSAEATAGGSGWNGKWNAPLVAGGVAGLAIGALANSHRAPPPPAYAPPPPYAAPPPAYADDYYRPVCRWIRQPLYDGYGQYAG